MQKRGRTYQVPHCRGNFASCRYKQSPDRRLNLSGPALSAVLGPGKYFGQTVRPALLAVVGPIKHFGQTSTFSCRGL